MMYIPAVICASLKVSGSISRPSGLSDPHLPAAAEVRAAPALPLPAQRELPERPGRPVLRGAFLLRVPRLAPWIGLIRLPVQ